MISLSFLTIGAPFQKKQMNTVDVIWKSVNGSILLTCYRQIFLEKRKNNLFLRSERTQDDISREQNVKPAYLYR